MRADGERFQRKEAAERLSRLLGVPVTDLMLAKLATQNRGPRFALVFGKAVYSQEALDEWAGEILSNESAGAKRGRKIAEPRRVAEGVAQ